LLLKGLAAGASTPECDPNGYFASLDEAGRVIGDFTHRDNTEWLIGRLGHRTPAEARAAAWAGAPYCVFAPVQETGNGTRGTAAGTG